jgi:hypothetical protein
MILHWFFFLRGDHDPTFAFFVLMSFCFFHVFVNAGACSVDINWVNTK